MTDFKNAIAKQTALTISGYRPGVIVHLRSPEFPMMLINLALNSDTLDVDAILMDIETGAIWMAPYYLMDRIDRQATPEEIFQLQSKIFHKRLMGTEDRKRHVELEGITLPCDETLSGSATRHRKGGTYTIAMVLGKNTPNPVVVYVSHSDGLWWTRPWSEFSDGRFKISGDESLCLNEIGLGLIA